MEMHIIISPPGHSRQGRSLRLPAGTAFSSADSGLASLDFDLSLQDGLPRLALRGGKLIRGGQPLAPGSHTLRSGELLEAEDGRISVTLIHPPARRRVWSVAGLLSGLAVLLVLLGQFGVMPWVESRVASGSGLKRQRLLDEVSGQLDLLRRSAGDETQLKGASSRRRGMLKDLKDELDAIGRAMRFHPEQFGTDDLREIRDSLSRYEKTRQTLLTHPGIDEVPSLAPAAAARAALAR